MHPRLLLMAALFLVLPLSAADWPLHRGNATQTGASEEKLPDKLAIRWEFKAKNSVEAAAVIADGVVYVPSSDKTLYALDLKA